MNSDFANVPALLSGLVMIGLIPCLAIVTLIALRRRVGFETLVVNNEVAGFKYATLGVCYAVLATFLMVSVWEKFEQAETAVEKEATALFQLFDLTQTLPPTEAAGIQASLTAYLDQVIDTEIATMRLGDKEYDGGGESLNGLGRLVLRAAAVDAASDPILNNLIATYVDVTDARRARIMASNGSLPTILWWFVVIGGLITVGFTFFFASQNIIAQAAMTGLLSVVIMSLVFTIITMNHPFIGDIAVNLDAYQDVRSEIGGHWHGPGIAQR